MLLNNLAVASVNNISMQVTIVNKNGEKVATDQISSLEIYEDVGSKVNRINNPQENPYTFTSLTQGHRYLVKVYVNGMYSGASKWISANSNSSTTVTIFDGGHMRFKVAKDNGYTVIDGAMVTIMSPDGKVWRSGETEKGYTPWFYLQPTTQSSEYYLAEFIYGRQTIYQQLKLKVEPLSSKEYKIVSTLSSRVSDFTVNLYDENARKITEGDGKSTILLFDRKYTLLGEKTLDRKGNAIWTKLLPGDYFVEVYYKPKDAMHGEYWGSSLIVVKSNAPNLMQFKKRVPYINGINTDQKDGSISVNVLNPDSRSFATSVRLIIDRDKEAPYDLDKLSESTEIGAKQTSTFNFKFEPNGKGTYHMYVIVQIDLGGGSATDQMGWKPVFTYKN